MLSHLRVPTFNVIFQRGCQPLVTLGWPQSVQEAQSMTRLPHDFVQCPRCAAFRCRLRRQPRQHRPTTFGTHRQRQESGRLGGTGKAAVFIHQFNVDAVRSPLVVDSDRAKLGTYVSSTGQPICYRDELNARPVDVVIIPMQWRAKDIVTEMRREGIAVGEGLIEHDGMLVDFIAGEHPDSR
jgi:hypothetical protein